MAHWKAAKPAKDEVHEPNRGSDRPDLPWRVWGSWFGFSILDLDVGLGFGICVWDLGLGFGFRHHSRHAIYYSGSRILGFRV